MAIYTNLPIYRATYSLLLSIRQMLPHLPRDCRYTMGQELSQKTMAIIILIYRANRTRRKHTTIVQMREILLEVQVSLRLLCDLRYISEAQYTMLIEQTVTMSKQMVAWEKKEKEKQRDESLPEDDL